MFQTFFWKPIINILFFSFYLLKDFGLGIIFTTAIIRFLLWPLFTQNEILQKKMQKIQPELKKIQAENKANPQQQTALLLEVYKTNKINPSFAFFFAFFQIFVIFGLFSAFSVAVRPDFVKFLYPTIANLIKTPINYTFLNLVDLTKPSLILALFATITQVLHGMITLKHLSDSDPQKNMMKVFTYVFPVIFIISFKNFKSAIFLYWTILTVINIAQTIYIRKRILKS